MAVTKRVRFEVLKRDNHTCRYCGATAPDVKLHVDHVIPIALGGTDKPNNLVAACKDCNAGKTSTNPNDDLVANVKESALAYATALRASIKEVTGSAKGLRRIRLNLETRWYELSDDYGYHSVAPLDENWGSTLRRWLELGLDEDFLLDAMEIAFAKYGVSRSDRFRYFCGVVYRTLDKAHELTQGAGTADNVWGYDEDGNALPPPCGHCASCTQDHPEDCGMYDNQFCETCKSYYCLYTYAHTEGQIHEHMRQWAIDNPEVARG